MFGAAITCRSVSSSRFLFISLSGLSEGFQVTICKNKEKPSNPVVLDCLLLWTYADPLGEPLRCMSHDNTWPIAKKFMSVGATRIKNPKQLVLCASRSRQFPTSVLNMLTLRPGSAIDHDVQNKSESNLKKYEQIGAFGRTHDVPFFPAGYGIAHQVMVSTPTP